MTICKATIIIIIIIIIMPDMISIAQVFKYVAANIVTGTVLSIIQNTTAADSGCKGFRDSYEGDNGRMPKHGARTENKQYSDH